MNTTKVDQAVKYFENDYNCCQSILFTYGEQFKLSKEIASRLGTGFGGGIARHGEVCGAVSGAIMIISLKYGMTNNTDESARGKTYDLVGEFFKRFKVLHESVRCGDLLGCDISTPKGREEAKEKDLFKTLCPKLVRSAAEILEELIL